eukprot:TRINITY_DN13514_c0_g1_i1.p2 TRINITY_DN13514_c0_g1~~TRINITY_DN13514_c0_g1_i1.p2  ORF type:complete len:120 (+),score=15.71 TRINITY_DN13514_c0_g1_i1:59-418(+)
MVLDLNSILAEHTVWQDDSKETIKDFLVVITILGSDLLTSVVFYLDHPATAITPMEGSSVNLGLGASTNVTWDDGTNETDFDIFEATEKACLKVRHIVCVKFGSRSPPIVLEVRPRDHW